jgi:RNA polymerase sigma-70 factor (ECF subfamily)
MTTPATPAAPISTTSDSEAWINALSGSGRAFDQAVASLYELLLGGARFEVARRGGALGALPGDELDDIAVHAADDALVTVLAKLDSFRGASRFTTWAYKFALLEAGTRVRRRAWEGREVTIASDTWTRLAETTDHPDVAAEHGELLRALSECVGDDLTPHQRQVVVALAIDGVPIDVLAERLGTTRGALYKTLHDARRKLRVTLAARGFQVEAS